MSISIQEVHGFNFTAEVSKELFVSFKHDDDYIEISDGSPFGAGSEVKVSLRELTSLIEALVKLHEELKERGSSIRDFTNPLPELTNLPTGNKPAPKKRRNKKR